MWTTYGADTVYHVLVADRVDMVTVRLDGALSGNGSSSGTYDNC